MELPSQAMSSKLAFIASSDGVCTPGRNVRLSVASAEKRTALRRYHSTHVQCPSVGETEGETRHERNFARL